jgi:hypothetical protein
MAEELTTIQISVEMREILRKLAGEDYRSLASELAWLVTHEWERRNKPGDEIQDKLTEG